MRTTWGKIYKISTLQKFDYSRHPLQTYGADTTFVIENFRNASRVGILTESLHKYYVSLKSSSYQLDSERLVCDRILDNLTCDFLNDKCGVISTQNANFLNAVYFNGIKDTLYLLLHSQTSITSKFVGLHELFNNENAKRLIVWQGMINEKKQLFESVANWISVQKKAIPKKQKIDDSILIELEIFLNRALNKSDDDMFNFLVDIRNKHPKLSEKLSIDEQIYEIMKNYSLLTGMTVETAIFLGNAVNAVLRKDSQTTLDEVVRLSDKKIPMEHIECYLLFSQYVCAASAYIEGWIFFKKLFAQFLLDTTRVEEACAAVNELAEILPDDAEVVALKISLDAQTPV